MHDGALNEPAAPVELNETVPVGVVAPAPLVSVTVAVQVDACPTTTGDVHETAVAVDRAFETTDPVPELVAWVVSPP